MRKRGRLLLVLVLVAVTMLCISLWVDEGPLWRWVMTKRVPLTVLGPAFNERYGHAIRGWAAVKRWSDRPFRFGLFVGYYVENGLIAVRGEQYEDITGRIRPARGTAWNFDGTVEVQWMRDDAGNQVEKESPPWWWDVTDQAEPTAPWWKGDEQ